MMQRRPRYQRRAPRDADAPVLALYAHDLLESLNVQPKDSILQVGAGNSDFALAAAREGAEVLVMDSSVSALEKLIIRAKAERLQSILVEIITGGLLNRPSTSCWKAVAILPMIGLVDRSFAFRELHRVLVPGGVAAFVTWTSPEVVRLVPSFADVLQRVVVQKAPQTPAARVGMMDAPDLEREITKAGFHGFHLKRAVHVWEADTPLELWEVVSDTAADAGSLSSIAGPEQVEALSTLFINALPTQGPPGPVALRAEALIGIGVR